MCTQTVQPHSRRIAFGRRALELQTRIDTDIEQAVEAGTFQLGVENILADSLLVASREQMLRAGCATKPSRPAKRTHLHAWR